MKRSAIQNCGPAALRAGLVLAVVLAVLCSCAPQGVQPVKDTDAVAASPDAPTVVVFPFKNMSALYGADQEVRSPLTSQFFVTGPVPEEGPILLTNRVEGFLRNAGFNIIPYEYSAGARAVGPENGSSEAAFLAQVGRRLGVDLVVAGYIYRFRDREGNRYSVEQPASVAFGLHLLRAEDGQLLWSARYDETQQPLSDNLFNIDKFFQRRGEWITASQLAVSGLESKLETFPRQMKKP